jgi:hypothetical protein
MNKQSIKLEEYAFMEWLRPEVVIWHSIADKLIGDELKQSEKIMEIAIGNGFFTFMALGGKFEKSFDHYFSTDLNKKDDNGDIYDCPPKVDISQFINFFPIKKLQIVLDNKQSTLDQVKLLELSLEHICQDANQNISFENIQTIYTNSIYWLKDPIFQLNRWCDKLPTNSKIILVFPNSSFYSYCRSYKQDSKMWRLLNRGRADTLMWSMDFIDFEKEMNKIGFRVIDYKRYLSKLTLQIDDIGLRPISPHLIKMANSLSPELRFEVKQEWVSTMMVILNELLENELEKGPKEGGYNFVVLEKRA